MKQDPLLFFLVVVLSIVFSLSLVEFSLQCFGVKPLGSPWTGKGTAAISQRDPKLGWKLIPGTHTAYAANGENFDLDVGTSGERLDPGAQGWTTESLDVALIGDSFIMGTGLAAEETLSAQISKMYKPTVAVNFGVLGYGTCQSLIRIRELLTATPPIKPKLIILGLNIHHEQRNLVDPHHFVRVAHASKSGTASPIRCYRENNVIRSETAKFYAWHRPFFDHFALGALIRDALINFHQVEEIPDPTTFTIELIQEIQILLDKEQIEFLVLIQELPANKLQTYSSAFRERKIAFLDGTRWASGPQGRIPNDGHPGSHTTELWAELLSNQILSLAIE